MFSKVFYTVYLFASMEILNNIFQKTIAVHWEALSTVWRVGGRNASMTVRTTACSMFHSAGQVIMQSF